MGGGNTKPVGEGDTTGVAPSAGSDGGVGMTDDANIDHIFDDGSAGDAGGGEDIAETTNFVFELIPFYEESDPDTASQIIETLESVTSQGVHIDTRDGFGNTLMMMSVHHQKKGLVEWALSQGGNIDAINFAGVCAMHIACHESSGNFELAKMLINYGADLEIPDSNGCTVLHYAASAGDSQLVSMLINAGSNALARDNNRFMPIDYALESGSEQCAALLLDAQTAAEDVQAALAILDDKNSGDSSSSDSSSSSSSEDETGGDGEGDGEEGGDTAADNKDKPPDTSNDAAIAASLAEGNGGDDFGFSAGGTGKAPEKKKKKKKKKTAARVAAEAGAGAGAAAAAASNASFVEYDGDWTEYIDSNSNTPYYFNQTTGETTWERPASMGVGDVAQATADAEGHYSGHAERVIPEGVQAKTKKKRRVKRKKKKKVVGAAGAAGAAGGSSVSHVPVEGFTRAQNNVALWRKIAWREGIRRVAAKKRKLAIQAAREHMMMEQQAMQAQRDAEMKLHLAEQQKREAEAQNAASSLQAKQIAELRAEFERKERELQAALEKERERTKALDTKTAEREKQRAVEIKRREAEREQREAERVAQLEATMQKQNADLAAMQKKLADTQASGAAQAKATENKLKAEIKAREEALAKERDEVAKWQKEHAAAAAQKESAAKALQKEQKLRKKYYNEMEDMKGKIRVYCRVRPMLDHEKARNCEPCLTIIGDEDISVEVKERRIKKNFQFDKVYEETTSQATVFADTKKLVQSAIDGYNVCIFAYGQTGTGKSYTITGNRKDQTHMGVMPRAFNEIFAIAARDKDKMEIKVSMYMLELYCDNLVDLLNERNPNDAEAPPPPKIVIRKNEYGTVMPQGIVIKPAASSDELFAVRDGTAQTLMFWGNCTRTQRHHNHSSLFLLSRSHPPPHTSPHFTAFGQGHGTAPCVGNQNELGVVAVPLDSVDHPRREGR